MGYGSQIKGRRATTATLEVSQILLLGGGTWDMRHETCGMPNLPVTSKVGTDIQGASSLAVAPAEIGNVRGSGVEIRALHNHRERGEGAKEHGTGSTIIVSGY